MVREKAKSYGVNLMPWGGVRARVPKIKEGYEQKFFGKREHKNPEAEAEKWVTARGLDIWGEHRWRMISQHGRLKRMRTYDHAVSVLLKHTRYERKGGEIAEYPYFIVSWYEADAVTELAKCFNPSNYLGSMEQAEHEANLFAAKKRAELTGGELHLPFTDFGI